MIRSGEVERISRGLYRRSSAEPVDLETVAAACALAPGAVVCLLSALVIHDIGTQAPHEVWIAVDRKARKPRMRGLPVRVVSYSGPLLRIGVATRAVHGVKVPVTTPARTVADCFRYRNKIGLDVALEALRDVLRRRLASVDELVRMAQACRVHTVMRPYLQMAIA